MGGGCVCVCILCARACGWAGACRAVEAAQMRDRALLLEEEPDADEASLAGAPPADAIRRNKAQKGAIGGARGRRGLPRRRAAGRCTHAMERIRQYALYIALL